MRKQEGITRQARHARTLLLNLPAIAEIARLVSANLELSGCGVCKAAVAVI